MKEKIEHRSLQGIFNVKCKYDDGSVRIWSEDKALVANRIITIVEDYRRQGYRLTLRQLHYQFVSKNWIINHDTAYKKLGGILDDCKYAGLIDWNSIEDRGRIPNIGYSVDDIADALQDTVNHYKLDRQVGQDVIIELWTEKDAISNILERVTRKYHIHLVVNKGYTSSSAIYQAYQRFLELIKSGKKVKVLYFGDHDPSGLDMIRDIRERLLKFMCQGEQLSEDDDFRERIDGWMEENGFDFGDVARNEYPYFTEKHAINMYSNTADDHDIEDGWSAFYKAKTQFFIEENDLFEVIQVGLTMNQIKELDLPPNPTKLTDARAKSYIEKFGRTCWEVDALNPAKLTEIIEEKIQEDRKSVV